ALSCLAVRVRRRRVRRSTGRGHRRRGGHRRAHTRLAWHSRWPSRANRLVRVPSAGCESGRARSARRPRNGRHGCSDRQRRADRHRRDGRGRRRRVGRGRRAVSGSRRPRPGVPRVIVGRMRRALQWRVGAITSRLDALHSRLESFDSGLAALDGRLAETHAALNRLESLAAALPQAAEDAAASREALETHVEPVLRAIVDEESENRRRLFALRSGPGSGEAYSNPDPLVSVTVATVGRTDALIDRALPSLLAQTHANLEVLVVGDAIGPSVGDAIAALGDPRVQYSNLSQRLVADADAKRHWLVGSTMARNEAARRARGSWL